MAVEEVYSNAHPDPAGTERGEARFANGRMRVLAATALIGAAADIASQYNLGKVPYSAVILNASTLDHAAMGTGCIGKLVDNADTTKELLAATSIAAAGAIAIPAVAADQQAGVPLYELLGYTDDPGGECLLILELTAASVAGGNFQLQLIYSNQ